MTNIFQHKQQGAVILVVVMIILAIASLLVFYTVNVVIGSEKVLANQYPIQQAFEATQAGIDYGVVYFNKNSASILVDSNADGTIDTNSFTVPVSGASATVSFTNPVPYDFNLIKITAVGTSTIYGTVTRTMTQLIKEGVNVYFPPVAVTAHNNADIEDTSTVSHPSPSGISIWAGRNITLRTGHPTINTSANDLDLRSLSSAEFFANFFGDTEANIEAAADYTDTHNADYNYSADLSGRTDELIWLNQTRKLGTIDGSITIGSADHPVILVLNGTFVIAGSVTIYGIVYVTTNFGKKSTEGLQGSAHIHGGIIVDGDYTMRNTSQVTYNATVDVNAENLLGGGGTGIFDKVQGSWKDF